VLRRLANRIVGRTGKPDRLDTATRMAADADFSTDLEGKRRRSTRRHEIDPVAELERIISRG